MEHNNLANNTERIYFNFNDLMLGLTIFGKMGNYWLTKILIDHGSWVIDWVRRIIGCQCQFVFGCVQSGQRRGSGVSSQCSNYFAFWCWKVFHLSNLVLTRWWWVHHILEDSSVWSWCDGRASGSGCVQSQCVVEPLVANQCVYLVITPIWTKMSPTTDLLNDPLPDNFRVPDNECDHRNKIQSWGSWWSFLVVKLET